MISLFCTSQSSVTFRWHPLMLQQEHPESLVSSLVLSEIEMAYFKTERKGLGHFCMFCGVVEKAVWWKYSSTLRGGKQTGFSPVSFVCFFSFQNSVYDTYRSSCATAGRMVLWIRYWFRPQEFGAQLVTLLTSFMFEMGISHFVLICFPDSLFVKQGYGFQNLARDNMICLFGSSV